MPDRRPPLITESIAEALRAGLAMIAVVLLARANAGALTKGPSTWVWVPICLIAWGAAAGAARWSRLSGSSRLCVWRDCVAPALVTLLIAGSGGSGSLAMGIGFVTIGSVAVGLAATCCRPDLWENLVAGTEVMPERKGEAPAEPLTPVDGSSSSPLSESFALPVDAESGHADRSDNVEPPLGECAQMNTPAPDAEAATQHQEPLPAALDEVVESTDDDSCPAESWTRAESDGEVSIEAVVLARFIEGSKLAVVHLPFVPPLPALPQIECEPLDSGCEVTIKVDAAYRHGARLSITRPSAGPSESMPIGVVVYTSAEEQVES